jgi:hypothetical protein
MPPPEARDHRVVGHVLAGKEAVARIAAAQPLDRPARSPGSIARLDRTPWP